MPHAHELSVGSPCPNCATVLQGPWCYGCGQKATDYHRSFRHLARESWEGLTDADARLWTTWRRLVMQPGRLTREYLDGKRAGQLPPLRLFLTAIVILLFAGPIGNLGPNKTRIQFAPPQSTHPRATKGVTLRVTTASTSIEHWLEPRLVKASRDPDLALSAMEQWSHYAAMLTVLVAAPLLAVAFIGQRQFYFHDHVIFSMHSLTFQAVLISLALIGGGWVMLTWFLLLLAPLHLFVHMRGTYRTTVLGTLLRMLFLFIGSAIGFGLLLSLLVIIGLYAES